VPNFILRCPALTYLKLFLHDLYAFMLLITYTRAGASENRPSVERWRWTRPNVHVYTSLVQGLAASLRVSDALRIIEDICQVGVSPGEEV
jgi:pentatricopeptide repeat protein